MNIILDTSAYSAFRRGNLDIVAGIQQADEIVMNPIALGELSAGFRKGRDRQKNKAELEDFLASPRVTVVDIDSETGERYALIINALWDAGTPIPTNDIWIAASAMQHGLRILTTDPHFVNVKQVVVDCFKP